MSRRYGRNQKRRHRTELAEARAKLTEAQERIANLMQSQKRDWRLLESQFRELSDLKAQLCSIAQEVGHQSVLAGVQTFLGGGFDGMRMAPPLLSPNKPITSLPSKYEALTFEVLRLLDVEAVRELMSGHLHFNVELAGKGVAYAITESAIRDLTPEFLERRIAPEIARRLVERLKKEISKC